MKFNNDWQNTHPQIFWGEIAPTDHVVQIYENDDIFLDSLEYFVSDGLSVHDCVVLIVTPVHANALTEKLKKKGFNIQQLVNDQQLILLDAQDTLSMFMVNDWPDENLFKQTISSILSTARARNRKVRAFGEMVALLWASGLNGATVRLENLWHTFCHNETFCLFCAYPKIGFTQDIQASINKICNTHAMVIAGEHFSSTELLYKRSSASPSQQHSY
jgi:hypothetical protein